MSRYLNAEELDISYGQSEPLTRRIHTILDDYKDGSAVLKELIQNADDAGASEIAFVHDRRDFTSQSRSLLGENMRSLQGPAVWSYNDAVFTDADFANIVKLSGATKEEETTKIGRFGLGFNAVYHLTDVPSFMSRENIVLFDPHTTYLGHSIRNPLKPGIKLNIVSHASRIKKFEDQFKPFLGMFGVNLQQSFNGTLFRLPLRTPEQARSSDISGKVYSEQEVTSLFRILYDEADTLLMFTQNVRKLTIYTISDDVKEMPKLEESFKIERKVVTVLKEMMPRLHEGVPEREPRILHTAKAIQENSGECPDVCNSGGYIIDIQVSDFSLERNQKQNRSCYWVVYGAVGAGEAAELSRKNKKLLPVGGVAGKLGYSDATKKYILEPLLEGKVFCFLPLPIRNELPVHTNGYFAITTSRTHLHGNEKTEKVDERALWNSALMGDAVCLAYTEMLCAISSSSLFDQDHIQKNIFDFFPTEIAETTEGRSNAIFTLMKMFLRRVFTELSVDLLPTSDKWTNGSNFKALDRYVRESENCKVFTNVCQSIEKHRNAFVDMPLSIYNDLERCELIDDVSRNLFTYQKLYDDVILPNMVLLHPYDAEQIIFHALTMVNNTLDGSLRSAKCIPVGRREQKVYQYAHKLVDPHSYLKDLFYKDEGYFPSALLQESSSVQREQWRTGLKRLGMRDEYLKADEVLERAYSTAGLDRDAAASRAQCLIRLLSKMNRSEKEVNVEELRTIQFIPKKEKPADWILPWVGDMSSNLLSMDDIYTGRDCTFLGSVLPVPEMSTSSLTDFGGLLRELNMLKEIQPMHVGRQIAAVEEYLENGSDNKNVGKKIADVMRSCYNWCEDYAGKNGEALWDRFADTPFVFVAGTQPLLVAPSKCAKHVKTDCSPYLNKLPSDFKLYYYKLTKALQVPERFEPNHYIEVLRNCAEEHGKNVVPSNVALPILHTIQGLAECIEEYQHNIDMPCLAELGTIYLLNDEGRFLPNTELSINVFDWISHVDRSKMCHSKISPANASTLGVRTNRESVLDSYALGVSFGQQEELTTRIKRILEGYPCDKEILKELLQNADDAEATEIHFVLDERQHKTEKLFSESWKHLQGPALLVFNDKPFSLRDIEGIQRLGEGSKADDAITTGKYGVGFNCVYHLTDTPTFLTKGKEIGEKLCAFDPQCKFVPHSDRSSPGRMYNVDEHLRNSFTDVFECYDFQEFIRTESTVFRLPLRSKFVAKDSIFSKTQMTTEHISRLFCKFQEEMYIALLFLSNVRKISLSKVNSSGRLQIVFAAEAEIGEEGDNKKMAYDAAVKNAATKIKRGATSIVRVPLTETMYDVSMRTSNEFTEQWLVCQRIGFSDRADIPAGLVQQYAQAKAALLPKGGVAFSLGFTKRKKQIGKTSKVDAAKMSSFDSKDSRIRIKPRIFCSLPLPQQSYLPMHVNGHFILDSENRHNIFHSEDNYSFKNKWNQCLLGSVVAEAYLLVLCEMKHRVPVGALHYSNISSHLNTFLHMFPHMPLKEVCRVIQNLQKSIYSFIIEHNLPLFPVLERQQVTADASLFPCNEVVTLKWKGVNDGVYFDDLDEQPSLAKSEEKLSLFKRTEVRSKPLSPSKILRNILLNCSFPLTAFPLSLLDRFRECVFSLKKGTNISGESESETNEKTRKRESESKESIIPALIVTPVAVLVFLRQYNHNGSNFHLPENVEKTPILNASAVKTAFDYVKQADFFEKHMEGLPLLLTQDGKLREFQAKISPVFATKYASLIPLLQHRFLDQIYAESSLECKKLHNLVPSYIKEMGVADFAGLLSEHLPKEFFFNQERVPFPGKEFANWLNGCYNFLHDQCFAYSNPESRLLQFNALALKPLNDWCIVPTVINKKKYLTRLERVHFLLSPFNLKPNAFNELVLPRVFIPCFPGEAMWNILVKMTANERNPWLLLQALVEHLMEFEDLSRSVRPDTATEILTFFNDNLEDLERKPNAREGLKRLPLHVTPSKRIVSLGYVRDVVIVPESACGEGIYKINARNVVFLENQGRLEKLHKFLDCEFPRFEIFYSVYVLPEIHALDTEEIYCHIDVIKHNIELNHETDGVKTLLEKLRSVPFIEKWGGRRSVTSNFYDKTESLFAFMHKGDDFPTEPYDGEHWIPFLKKIGLKSKVTCDTCVKYATEIETGVRDVEDAQKLVRCILDSSNQVLQILNAIQHIAFLPRGRLSSSLINLAEPCKTKNLVSYSVSTSPKYANLCWTVIPFLCSWAIPSKGKVLKPPKSLHVRQHLKNVYFATNSTLKHKSKSFVRRIQEIFIDCLKYIEEQSLNDEELETLSDTYVAVSDTGDFYKASQLVCDIDKEWRGIQPILCQLPKPFGGLEGLLKRLGMTEEITLEQATSVLSELHSAANGKHLLGNQMIQAICATKIIFLHLQMASYDVKLTGLYFPSRQGNMISSCELYLIDQPGTFDRSAILNLKLLYPLDNEDVESTKRIPMGVQLKAIKRLPCHIRPRMLSSAIREVLDENCLNEIIHSEELKRLEEKLKGRVFHHCVLRLMKHGTITSDSVEEINILLDKIESALLRVQCIAVRVVQTYLYLVEENVKWEKSENTRGHFIVNSETGEGSINLYMSEQTTADDSVLCMDLAEALLEWPLFKDSVELQTMLPMLIKEQLQNMEHFLNGRNMEKCGHSIKQLPALPTPGCFVPLEYVGVLDQSISRLYVGEYCALEVDDVLLDCEREREGDDEAIYIYVKVCEIVLPNEGSDDLLPVQYQYKVNTGTSTRTVEAVYLYRLKEYKKSERGDVPPDALTLNRCDGRETGAEKNKPQQSATNVGENDNNQVPDTLKEIKNYITRHLMAVSEIGKKERRATYKRLALQFHPDKNPDRVEIAKQAFQFLQNQIDVIENAADLQTAEAESTNRGSFGSNWFERNFDYTQFNARAKRHRRQREQFTDFDFRGFSRPNRSQRWKRQQRRTDTHRDNPQPTLSRIWLRQAQYDLSAVSADQTENNFEWACYKCHQAAKKATKAAQLSVDASYDEPSHDTLISCDCHELMSQLRQVTGREESMQFPDTSSQCDVPHDRYTCDMAKDAFDITRKIVKNCKDFVYKN